MAKSKTNLAATEELSPVAGTPVSTDDRKLAAKAIRSIRGCGIPESEQLVAAMPDATIQKIAAAERTGQRREIPAMLAATT